MQTATLRIGEFKEIDERLKGRTENLKDIVLFCFGWTGVCRFCVVLLSCKSCCSCTDISCESYTSFQFNIGGDAVLCGVSVVPGNCWILCNWSADIAQADPHPIHPWCHEKCSVQGLYALLYIVTGQQQRCQRGFSSSHIPSCPRHFEKTPFSSNRQLLQPANNLLYRPIE